MNPLNAIARIPGCVLGLRQTADGTIEEIVFMPPETPLEIITNPVAESFCLQLEQYRQNPAQLFNLPLLARGTIFQQRVWHSIRTIPAGQTLNYGDIADRLGSAPRAIGQACGANPFPLVTPCHRVLGKSSMGGFSHATGGWLLDTKRWLLQHEGAL
ncbi:methylated-DNA--[protein]-cysteine S-methyltransferase [Uliginosibacterium sp. 31-12]|uniref:methylated-DNA--[protein]-cysteine S-methyltransferase n=1 Tax=Uliginosibacterium sp. 31-12 TaxID=3062781 RepID=UPI0026E2E4D5|nr:methylated-DNA--[protein]-cysteine S-methyltransferase [Uliginosibacterium sp. 31-12]MDO6385980.1 methylated-DNA--[protein]-cysteine S-methyltransferase [Uliginosibacterium sp. 31-12]